MYFNAVVSGTPPFDYTWGFSDEDFTYPSFATTNSFLFTNQISRFFGPFDALPQSFYLTMERFKNGNRVGFDGAYGSPPSCGPVCLSVGTLSTRTGTDGSGTNVPLSSSCGPFPPGCRWFRMTTLPNAGMAMVSTEGSTYDTILGVFSGSISSPGSLVPVACNNDISSSNKQSLVQFETQPNTSYWLVVNTNNTGTLKLTYGYNLNFGSVALNPVSHALDIRSAPVPSYQYQLLASTNLASLNWTIVATTNFTGNTITTNNIFRFSDTNGPNNRQRFYRIRLVQ